MTTDDRDLILLTGATGYVGGRLLDALVDRGARVRCLARRPSELDANTPPEVEVVGGDVLDAASLGPALRDVDCAYYLIHSMGSGADFEEEDRRAARNFANAAREAGVRRIVYLGGLGRGEKLSAHLRSRQEVGAILRESGAEVIELRASIVIGSGSLSFEMVRALVERLPVMITPRWVDVPAQPIAIQDLIRYLARARELPPGESRIYEIGGADRTTYGGLMHEYARQRGLRRKLIRVPFLTPRLSSLWLGLVTPIYARVGRKLVESLRHPTVVEDDAARRDFDVRPMGVKKAIAAALRLEDREVARTRWFDALSAGGATRSWAPERFGNRLIDARSRHVDAPTEVVYDVVRRIGGDRGWYAYDWLWSLRGFLDLLVGGVGVRRGRAHPTELAVGQPLDFWRVQVVEPGRRLRLKAEMKLPGRAWLEFEVVPESEGPGSVLKQTAIFDPVGLSGLLYWWAVYPLHLLVFPGMLRNMARAAEAAAAPREQAS